MRGDVWFPIIIGVIALFSLITPGSSFSPLIIPVLAFFLLLRGGGNLLDIYEKHYPDILADMYRQEWPATLINVLFFLLLIFLSLAWLYVRLRDRASTPVATIISIPIFSLLTLTLIGHLSMNAYLLAYFWTLD
ncbi:MAG: hypothetical protein AAGD92_02150 [Pseudomonadota bacterium]